MQPEVAKYLLDVRDACEAITNFTQGKSFDDYRTDRLLRDGVEREFITIGEALLKTQKLDPCLAQLVTGLRRIVSFRNVLVHDYAKIEEATVWGVVQKDLPTLKQEVESLLSGEGHT